jgi:hypothetical protein
LNKAYRELTGATISLVPEPDSLTKVESLAPGVHLLGMVEKGALRLRESSRDRRP